MPRSRSRCASVACRPDCGEHSALPLRLHPMLQEAGVKPRRCRPCLHHKRATPVRSRRAEGCQGTRFPCSGSARPNVALQYSPGKADTGFSASSDGASAMAPRLEERLLLVLVGGSAGSASTGLCPCCPTGLCTCCSVSELGGSASASVAVPSVDKDTARSSESAGASCLRSSASSSLCTGSDGRPVQRQPTMRPWMGRS